MTSANGTRVRYAQSLLRFLHETLSKENNRNWFFLAVQLLIESLRRGPTARYDWTEALVDAYIDDECVGAAIARASAYVGCRRERELVVIELFRLGVPVLHPEDRRSRFGCWYISPLWLESSRRHSRRRSMWPSEPGSPDGFS